MSVAQWLAHDHDVGDDALVLERPEARPHPPEPGLYFIGDGDATGRAHVRVHLGKVAWRKHDLPADARTRLGDEAGDASTALPQTVDHVRNVPGVHDASVRLGRPVRAAVHVGNRNRVDPLGCPGAARAGVLVGTQVDEPGRVAVIRRL